MSEDTVPFDPTRETVVVYKADWLAVNQEINTLRDAMQRRREADQLAGEAIRLCNDMQASVYPAITQMLGAAKSLFDAADHNSDRIMAAIYDMQLPPKRKPRKKAKR